MGFLDIFNKKTTTNQESQENKTVFVDEVYLIDIPKDWSPYESDRFRTINKSKKINFSATNYGKPIDMHNRFTVEELEKEIFVLFDRFVNEGGYEPIDDRTTGKDFVYQSFKVDGEIQYYYYTFREGQGMLIRIYFILKEKGKYNAETKSLLFSIGESIMTKIA